MIEVNSEGLVRQGVEPEVGDFLGDNVKAGFFRPFF